MTNPRVVFGLFVAAAMVQLAVPVNQILKHEDILRTGRAYKFRTAPVDPYDAFRGRYVALGFDGTAAPVRAGDGEPRNGQPAYVRIEEGADGFVVFKEVSLVPPSGADYVRIRTTWRDGGDCIRFTLPFDKLFMEESSAPKAEEMYRRHGNRRGQTSNVAYAVVRVKGGRGVIEDLFINDMPVREFIKTMSP